MGHHNIRFEGDAHALNGAWSPSTSRANFCEEDYALTFYIAEFINSVTNLSYVYYALRYMYGPPGKFAPRWDFMSLSLLVLGIGSFLFHASLRQTLEFADELSMLVLNWSMLHAVLAVRQSKTKRLLISVGLAVTYLGFSGFYLYSAKIIYQVIAFFFGLFLIILRTQYLFFWIKPSFPNAKASDWRRRSLKSTGISIAGYVLWNIDLEYCHQLREFRQQIGLPWGWLLELHGWWHVLTAIGAGQFMDVAREMREEVVVGKTE